MNDKTLMKLHVKIMDIAPSIWRLVVLPEETTLFQFHKVLQAAFGWTNSHLHEFRTKTSRFSSKSPHKIDSMWMDADDEGESEEDTTIGSVLKRTGASMVYTYDMGDNWEHLITLKGPCLADKAPGFCAVLDGARACPPEDCGGVPGYENLVEIMSDANHPEHEEMIDWLGERFDPDYFDVTQAHKAVKKLFRIKAKKAVKKAIKKAKATKKVWTF